MNVHITDTLLHEVASLNLNPPVALSIGKTMVAKVITGVKSVSRPKIFHKLSVNVHYS